jgi:hypothetical protein
MIQAVDKVPSALYPQGVSRSSKALKCQELRIQACGSSLAVPALYCLRSLPRNSPRPQLFVVQKLTFEMEIVYLELSERPGK